MRTTLRAARAACSFTSTLAVVAIACTAMATSARASGTDDASQATAAQAAISAATGDVGLAAPSSGQAPPGNAIVATAGAATVAIPTDPSSGIDLSSSTGQQIGIQLPGAAAADDAQVRGGNTVVYTDALPSTSIAVQPMVSGGVRALVTIESATAPTEYRFPVEVPDGGFLRATKDGAVLVWGADGTVSATFDAPWAIDASGAMVPTTYTVDGTTIVQTVQHAGFSYPVVADPEFTWGIVTGTVYFSRSETKSMTKLTTVLRWAGALCAYYGVATLGAACAVAGAIGASWVVQAKSAWNSQRCLKIKIPTMEAGSYPKGKHTCR